MKITANGISVHYTLEGAESAPVVTLSHSLATHSAMWDPQMEVLRQTYRVLRYDTRGHGQTDAPSGAYTLDDLADDARALLEALGIERTHFIGLSMGGMLGQLLALKAPQRLASLVLCDTSSRVPPEAKPIWQDRIRAAQSDGMEPLVEPTLQRWFTPSFRQSRPEVMEWIGGMIRSTAVSGYVGCCHALAALNLTDRLHTIRIPAFILVGEEDPGTPVAAARVIHEQISGSELRIIKSASHLSNVEQAGEFNAAVTAFLDRVRH